MSILNLAIGTANLATLPVWIRWQADDIRRGRPISRFTRFGTVYCLGAGLMNILVGVLA